MVALWLVALVAGVEFDGAVCRGDEANKFDSRQVRDRVLPLLASKCGDCHGAEQQEGGLRLDVRRRAMAGGDTALAIVAGASDRSELMRRITSSDEKLRMPRDAAPLTADEVDLLRRWIDAGAPWPDSLAGTDAAVEHWSFRPLGRPAVPHVKRGDWSRSPLDAFVLARLERERIEPSPEASTTTLARRLSLDLLGLPPSPVDVADFQASMEAGRTEPANSRRDDEQAGPDAYERLVDRWLASPRFGERWGKHWLDLARFAESDGYENDKPRPNAWRFREWVIEAINADLPFDQFTIKQLAGDLLDDARPADRVAVGFHRNTLHNSAGGADQEEFRTKAVKDRVAVTGAAWLGLTLNCCECHSHKYDPISQREYYQFYAFFNNADQLDDNDVSTFKATTRKTHVHRRGNFLESGAEVAPGVPSIFPPLAARRETADRLDLARWLVAADNPLAPRVAANHVWQHLFGLSLTATPENFGRRGEPPANSQLLDWLAARYIAGRTDERTDGPMDERNSARTDGRATINATAWSRKSLVREIVCSATYRQSSDMREAPPSADPDNRLSWKQNRYRVEAEVVRDVALAASGLLDSTIGGRSVQPPLPRGLGQLNELKNERFQEPTGNPRRRGLYVHVQRTFPFPLFATFDAPDGNQCTVRRDRSTTPLQALSLLNDPTIDECAKVLGRRLRDESLDDDARLRFGFRLCVAREPSDGELAVLRELVKSQREAGADDEAAWRGVARSLLNLDETITRP